MERLGRQLIGPLPHTKTLNVRLYLDATIGCYWSHTQGSKDSPNADKGKNLRCVC